MTQEQEKLLIKDLCARLPYGVILNCCGIVSETLTRISYKGLVNDDYDIDEVKPYLFPMSSMTEEQTKELNDIFDLDIEVAITNIKNDTPNYITNLNRLNWLLKNHFDIYGLIPMGLANDATGLNIYQTMWRDENGFKHNNITDIQKYYWSLRMTGKICQLWKNFLQLLQTVV